MSYLLQNHLRHFIKLIWPMWLIGLAFNCHSADPVAHYKFEEANQGVVIDTSIYNRNLQLNADPIQVNGIDGLALSLNGLDQYAVLQSQNGIFFGSNPKALSFWFKTEESQQQSTLLSFLGENECESLHLRIDQSETLYDYLLAETSCDSQPQAALLLNKSDSYHFIGLSQQNGQTKIFFDGRPIYSQPSSDKNFYRMCLGGKVANNQCQDLFMGSIDDLKLYDSSLSAADIESIYLGVLPPMPAPAEFSAELEEQEESVHLRWEEVDAITSPYYAIYRDGSLLVTGVTNNEYVDSEIILDSEYQYSILAIDEFGRTSTSSAEYNISTAPHIDTAAPTTPQNLRTEDINSYQVTIAWSPSSDTGGHSVGEYLIYRNGTQYGFVNGTITRFIDTNISPGLSYGYQVSAVDSSPQKNESSRSENLSVTIPASDTLASCMRPTGENNSSTSPNTAFSNAQKIIGKATTTVDWGDIDGDGDADVFAAEGGKHSCGDDCRMLSWFEAPTWEEHNLGELLGPFTGDSKLADIDSDGDLDVVISVDAHNSNSSSDGVYWFENNISTNQSWTKHTIEQNLPDAYHIGDVEVADVDGDGQLDVVVRHLGSYRFVVYFQNTKDNWNIKRINTRPREGLSLADVDLDGKADIIANGYILFAPANPRLDSWPEKTFDSAFYSQATTGLNNSSKTNVADFNLDGRPDILISSAEGESTYLAWYESPSNTRAGTWQRHVIEQPQGKNHQALIADVDNDGDLDVAGGFSFGDEGVYWWENMDGLGTSWTRHVINSDTGCYSCVLSDFDNDGDIDLMGPNAYVGDIYFYKNMYSESNSGNSTSSEGLFDINASLTHYYPLNNLNPSGQLANAVAEQALTPYLPPEFADGIVGNSASMSDPQVFTAENFETKAEEEITLGAWIKLDNFDSVEGRVLSQATSPQGDDHYLMISQIDASGLRVRLKVNGHTHTLATDSGVLNLNQWQHVAATYDGSTISLYLNAQRAAQRSVSGLISVNNQVSLALGNQPPGAGDRPFNGMIDEVRIYDKALSIGELEALITFNGSNCE